jgi:hypothetical protein
MAILLNDNIYIRAGKPLDYKYGPFLSINQANSFIPIEERYNGLIFAVYEDPSDIQNTDILLYYYYGGFSDTEIIEIDKRPYIHPIYNQFDFVLSGATVLDYFKTDEIGSVVSASTRTLTFNDLGLFDPISGVGNDNFLGKFTNNGTSLTSSVIYNNGNNIGIDNISPTEKLDINGKLRIRNIQNLQGDVITVDSLGVISKRTYPQILTDINAQPFFEFGTVNQYFRGDKTFQDLTTNIVTEGDNLYFTLKRSRESISLTTNGIGGLATYNNFTGVFNIPNYQPLLVNPVTGTGADKQITFWNSNNSITGSTNFLWHSDINRLSVNTPDPTDTVDINGTLRVRNIANQAGNILTVNSNGVLKQRTAPQIRTDINAVEANLLITGATNTKITFDSKGLVIAGTNLVESDIPTLQISKINNLQSELNSKLNKNGDTMLGNLLISPLFALDSTLTTGTDILNIGTDNADVINIGWSGTVVNIHGSLLYQNVENLEVKDKLIRLNRGGSIGSGFHSGFEIEENNIVTAYFNVDANRDGWDFKAPLTNVFTLGLESLNQNIRQNVQNVNGTIALVNAGSFDTRYEAAFNKGSIQIGEGFSFTGNTTNRLYGSGDVIIKHEDTSSFNKTTLTGPTVISNITVDTFGHTTDWSTRDIYPIAKKYTSTAQMMGDKQNQIVDYIYFDGDVYWTWLGTNNGDISDYSQISSTKVTDLNLSDYQARSVLKFDRMTVSDDPTNKRTVITRPPAVIKSETPPAFDNLIEGDEWIDTINWKTYIYYDEFWVENTNHIRISESVEDAESFALMAKTSELLAEEYALSAITQTQIATDQAIISTNAASTSTQQAILSAAARDDAEAANIAAQGFADDAETSAQNALESEQEATVQAGIATSAAASINQIDFTGANNGDLLQRESGVFVPKSPTLVNQSKVPFANSPLFAYNGGGEIIAWDNSFNKPNENPRTTTDSGHIYTRLSGTGNIQISNGKLSKTNVSDIFVVNTGGVGSVEFKTWCRVQPGNRPSTFIIGKDIDNYIFYQIGTSNTILSVVIGGVTTNIYTQSTGGLFRNSVLSDSGAIDIYSDISFSVFQGSISQPFNNLSAYIRSEMFPFLNRDFNLDSYISTFPTKDDISFCGWGSGFGTSNPISSWTIKSISP